MDSLKLAATPCHFLRFTFQVNVEVELTDDVSVIACLLEEVGFAVNPSFLHVHVDMNMDYHF